MENRHSRFDISCNEQVLYRTGKSIYPHILLGGYMCAPLGYMVIFFGNFDPVMILVVIPMLIYFIGMLLLVIKTIYTQKDNEVQITDRGVYWYFEGLNGFIAHEDVERYGFHSVDSRITYEIYLEIVAKDKKDSRLVILTYTKYSLKMINEILSKYNKGQQLRGKPKVRWDFLPLFALLMLVSPFVILVVLWILGVI